MMTLKWSEIHKAADGKTLYIEHEQVKTKNRVTIPLSDEALKWMPRKAKDIDTVFHQLRITSTTVEVVLGEWMQEAGIQPHRSYPVADLGGRPLHREQDTRTQEHPNDRNLCKDCR